LISGRRTWDSANRRLGLNHSTTVVCIRSDTRHRGGVVKSQASVRGIPGSTPEIKVCRFHQNLLCPCEQLNYESSVLIVAFFSLRPHPLVWVPMAWLSVRHHGRTSSCRAGSPYGILLARNQKYPSMVGYPDYSFTPGLNLDSSMPHAHPVHKDSGL